MLTKLPTQLLSAPVCAYSSCQRQAGFLLPLALFMIIFASGLALIMLRQVSLPTTQVVTSALAAQSQYAARTGAGIASNELFFPIADRQQMDVRCENLNIPSVFNVAGLSQCQLSVSCECRYEDTSICDSGEAGNYNGSLGIEDSFYRIQSEASCGSGFAQGYRRVELNKRAP